MTNATGSTLIPVGYLALSDLLQARILLTRAVLADDDELAAEDDRLIRGTTLVLGRELAEAELEAFVAVGSPPIVYRAPRAGWLELMDTGDEGRAALIRTIVNQRIEGEQFGACVGHTALVSEAEVAAVLAEIADGEHAEELPAPQSRDRAVAAAVSAIRERGEPVRDRAIARELSLMGYRRAVETMRKWPEVIAAAKAD